MGSNPTLSAIRKHGHRPVFSYGGAVMKGFGPTRGSREAEPQATAERSHALRRPKASTSRCSSTGITRPPAFLRPVRKTITTETTPAAKPVRALWTPSFRSFQRKNTQAAPAADPMNGIRSPVITVFIFFRTVLSFHRAPTRQTGRCSLWSRSRP